MREWMKDVAVAAFYLSATFVLCLLTGDMVMLFLGGIMTVASFLLLKNYREVLSALMHIMIYFIALFVLIRRVLPFILEKYI